MTNQIAMENFTDFDGVAAFQRNFVKMAVDEYNSPQQNWTDLIIRYWTVIDERLGGKEFKIAARESASKRLQMKLNTRKL